MPTFRAFLAGGENYMRVVGAALRPPAGFFTRALVITRGGLPQVDTLYPPGHVRGGVLAGPTSWAASARESALNLLGHGKQ